jgi:HSP20 family protein
MFSELNRTREHWTEIEPSQGRSQPAVWVPAVDIFADGEDLVIRCELAGVAKEDIDVSLSDGRLWNSGERIEVTGAENEQARLDVTG